MERKIKSQTVERWRMNDQPLSNDQASDLGDFTVGNDGCTIIMDQTVNSPTPSSDSPMPSSVRGKRNTIRDLFKGTFFDEFKFEDSPEYSASLKKVMLNGKDILALRQEDLEKMSLDEAKNLLFQIHLEGNLRKKGFRGLQMWKRRYFRILGSTLVYFDVSSSFPPCNTQVNNLKVARRTSEITADGKVMVENIPDHPYAFSIIPNKSERLYIVEAYSTQQRVMTSLCLTPRRTSGFASFPSSSPSTVASTPPTRTRDAPSTTPSAS